MADTLGLTSAQQVAVNKLYAKAIDSAEPLLRDLDQTEAELARFSGSAAPSNSAADELRKTAQDLIGKIEGIWSKCRAQVLAVLTSEQRQQYETLASEYGPYGCRGWGRGYGRGMGRHLRWVRNGYGRWRGGRW
jgi:hypothetical protein